MNRLVAVSTAAVLVGCSSGATAQVEVTNARVWAPSGSTTAVFFDVVNFGSTPDVLVDAATDVAEASIHETTTDGGVSSMRPVDQVPIPAHSTVRFSPGGLHVMLVGEAPLTVGDQVQLRLRFQRSGTIDLEVPVTMIETP